MVIGRRKKAGANGLNWFGVKTLFRTAAVGKPVAPDEAYDPDTSIVEERVVLFRARGFGQAIREAEREACSYARSQHVNPYGQRVVTRYLGACEAFELLDFRGAGSEVFSTTEVVPRRVPDKAVVNQRLGHAETAGDSRRRRNVLDRELSGSATLRV